MADYQDYGPVAPSPTRTAIEILRARFPQLLRDNEDATLSYDPSGSLAVKNMRDVRLGELEDRLVNDEAGAAIPHEGYVQGEPGRRSRSNAPDVFNLLRTRGQLRNLSAEAAADPYTGEAEQARVKGVRDALDETMLAQRPEMANLAKTVAERNAFAAYMKEKGLKTGGYEALASPEGQAAAEVPFRAAVSPAAEQLANEKLKREQDLLMSPRLAPGQMPTGAAGGAGAGDGGATGGIPGFTMPPNLKPLGVESERSMNAMRQAAPLLGTLETMLDPSKAELPNKLGQSAKWAAYKMGITETPFLSSSNPDPEQAATEDARNQARLQLASMITVIGSTPFLQGSRNYQRIKDIEKHLTDPTASDKFLYNQVQELKRLWPIMQQELLQAHIDPSAPLNFDALKSEPTEADLTNPNWK